MYLRKTKLVEKTRQALFPKHQINFENYVFNLNLYKQHTNNGTFITDNPKDNYVPTHSRHVPVKTIVIIINYRYQLVILRKYADYVTY